MKNHPFRAAFVSIAAIVSIAAQAQSPRLVKDFNTTTPEVASSSRPHSFVRYGSRVFFIASKMNVGTELWSTDGTAEGTSQIIRIAGQFAPGSPRFTIVNGNLLFNARDSRGEELWMTDGTTAGTRMMADIGPGSSSSTPGDRIVFHDQMLFAANEPVNGTELWVTDGTPGGTRLFKNLEPGSASSNPHSFALLNGVVYFGAAGALWKTDGTEAGTVIVKVGVHAWHLFVVGSRLFFAGITAEEGMEPWVSDGTEAGTRMIADIAPGTSPSIEDPMTAFGDRVLFQAKDAGHGREPWISDGTAGGTRMVRDIMAGSDSSMNRAPITVVGGTAFFAARGNGTGEELWKTDGTEAGTMLVRDILPGSQGSTPRGLLALGGKVYFAAGQSELWITDGTSAGTHPFPATGPKLTVGLHAEQMLTNLDGTIYFSGESRLNGYEPWKSDGTDAGTAMISNLVTDMAPSSNPANLTAAADWIYFDLWDGSDSPDSSSTRPRSLWRSDGTPEGTVELLDENGIDYTAVGRNLFFVNDGLWTSDGTPAGTRQASEFAQRFPGVPSLEFVLGDTIMVSVAGKLLATKAAPGSVAVSLDTSAGVGYNDVAGRLLYFVPKFSPQTFSLHATDGTPAGTYIVAADLTGAPNERLNAVMGRHLYFVSNATLWKSDGTFAGTVIVKVLPSAITSLTAAGRNVFFAAGGPLWVSDGSESGTRELPVTPTPGFVAAGDRVIFSAEDSVTGSEIWVSDGTPDGTRLLRDIYPGASGSDPSWLTSFGGVAYFRAVDDLHGYELWMTDGTAEGTRIAADVEPGPTNSAPEHLVGAGNQLFFTATTTATGNELWALPLSPTPRLAIGDIRVAESSSTAIARFTVTLSSASAQSVTVQYETADSTATSGSDYDATTGTLLFAPGETSKTIDVPLHADGNVEHNEAFFVTLRNSSGAMFEKATAFAVIEDDDRIADIGLSLDFSNLAGSSVFSRIRNQGPSAATNVRGFFTATPANSSIGCSLCPRFPFQLSSGETVRTDEYHTASIQQYFSLTATARERDPNPSDNRVGWTTRDSMAMDALHLNPGSEANVWVRGEQSLSTLSIESSNPAVISVPGSVAVPEPGSPVSFVARGIGVGTATIRVFSSGATVGSLQVEVLAPGTAARWPGALIIVFGHSSTLFDRPAELRILTHATAPFNKETATGLVTVKANGREVGRVTLSSTSESRDWDVPYYAADIGSNAVTVEYAGDENFLPQTENWNLVATRGFVSITGLITERAGTNARVRIRVTGSPMASPTGTVTVTESGGAITTPVSLVPTADGVGEAILTLSNVSTGAHTLVIGYSGDARYLPSTQNMRLADERRRAVRH